MENNQMTIYDIADNKPIEKQKKESGYFSRMGKLEKQVSKLEKQIEIIVKSLRR